MNLITYSRKDAELFIRDCCERLIAVNDNRSGSRIIREYLARYTIFDLQYIGGYIKREVDKLPNPYREKYRPYSMDLINQYATCMGEARAGICPENDPIKEPELWKTYWELTPDRCLEIESTRPDEPFPQMAHPLNKLFYRLVYGEVMLIRGGYGHPIGMPFPVGFTVLESGGKVLCPIRDKEKDLPTALCNYCPAEQDPNIS